MRTIIIIFLGLIAFNAHAKLTNASIQESMNEAVVNSDTILIGRVLERKEVQKGFILNDSSWPIGIARVEVLKVYRGKVVKGEQRLVCTWFDIDRAEQDFDLPIGEESLFMGIDTGLTIQLPMVAGHVLETSRWDKELARALKLPGKPNKDRNSILLLTGFGHKITRNACNEADVWEKAQAPVPFVRKPYTDYQEMKK